MYVLT
jgi:hypothetical protein